MFAMIKKGSLTGQGIYYINTLKKKKNRKSLMLKTGGVFIYLLQFQFLGQNASCNTIR